MVPFQEVQFFLQVGLVRSGIDFEISQSIAFGIRTLPCRSNGSKRIAGIHCDLNWTCASCTAH
jgi:hypothetical protein